MHSDRQPSVIEDELEDLCGMMRPINVAEAINRANHRPVDAAQVSMSTHSDLIAPIKILSSQTNTTITQTATPSIQRSHPDVIVLESLADAQVNTPQSHTTSCTHTTDYNDLPQPIVKLTPGSDAGPICHSSSRASPQFDASSVMSSDLDGSVEKILTKYAMKQSVGGANFCDQVSIAQLSHSSNDSMGARVKALLQRIDVKNGNRKELSENIDADIKYLINSDQSSTVSQSSSLHTSDLLEFNDLQSNDDTVMQRVRQLLSDGSDTSIIADEARNLCDNTKLTHKEKTLKHENRSVPAVNLFPIEHQTSNISQGIVPLIDNTVRSRTSSVSQQSSVSYDGLQRDLDDIQHGLRGIVGFIIGNV